MNSMRLAFEAWARTQPTHVIKDLQRYDDDHPDKTKAGQYGHCSARDAWDIWQAANGCNQAALAEIRKEIERIRGGAEHWGGWSGTQDACDAALEALNRVTSSAVTDAAGQIVAERCAQFAELYRKEHAGSREAEEACTEIAEACRQYAASSLSSAPVAQWQTKLRNPILPECDVWINVSEEGARGVAAQHPEIYEIRALSVVPTSSSTWTPTAENINALPEPIRNYIHSLETNTDPAGMVRENAILRHDNAEFESRLAEVSKGALK